MTDGSYRPANRDSVLAEIRGLAACPACGGLCRDPQSLQPCQHAVCRRCLPGDGWELAGLDRPRIRCPVCRAHCRGTSPHHSLAALADLLSLWPKSVDNKDLARQGQLSLVPLLRRLRQSQELLRPEAVLHFPGPPLTFQCWPTATAKTGVGGQHSGVAAILRDANNQRLWATVAGEDGDTARPVLAPDLGEEEYTISGFCLAWPGGRGDNSGVDGRPLVVLTDFYRHRLVVCDLDGRCRQRLTGIPRPNAVCSDASGNGDCVFALAANGTELRAFRWRRQRLVPANSVDDNGEGKADVDCVFRHSKLRYGRAIAVGAGRVCVADSASSCVLVIDRRHLLEPGKNNGVTELIFNITSPITVAVAACSDGDSVDGCLFVNSVGANRRKCVAICDLANGRRLAELPCGFACACGCPGCVDAGNDADIGAVHFDAACGRLIVARRARASHALVFDLANLGLETDDGESRQRRE